MKTKKALVNSWLNKANKDLLSARHELSFKDAVTETVCFHCQQAVEKYLKAYLVYLGLPFTKTHEIGELITKCESKDKEISKLKEEADKLTDYAIEIRYPDEWYEPTLEEAKEAFEIATEIRDFFKIKLSKVSNYDKKD
jgi:HEPN domain-containing protein